MMEPLIARADTWFFEPASNMPVDSSEAVVALALKGIARIKLNSARIKVHRYCAFSDTPIFSEKHCDLKPAARDVGMRDGEAAPSACGCSGLFEDTSNSSSSRPSTSPLPSPSSSLSSASSSNPSIMDYLGQNMPFSSHLSAKFCLKAALTIAQSFETLPYPNAGAVQGTPVQFASNFGLNGPRTMPAFACCAMQSSYAMLMLCQKTRATTDANSNQTVGSLLRQLRQGLQKVVGALENYSMSFEALSGMRGEFGQPFPRRSFLHVPSGHSERKIIDSTHRSDQRCNGGCLARHGIMQWFPM